MRGEKDEETSGCIVYAFAFDVLRTAYDAGGRCPRRCCRAYEGDCSGRGNYRDYKGDCQSGKYSRDCGGEYRQGKHYGANGDRGK